MEEKSKKDSLPFNRRGGTALNFLVESALRTIMSERGKVQPKTREERVVHLVDALMSESDSAYRAVLGTLMSSGVTSEEIYQYYIPEAARYIGELWVQDRASFVDVTVGAGRLQQLYRADPLMRDGRWPSRTIPLGQSILMVIPRHEDHSLGAFAAADQFRRHGIWVHMAISLDNDELAEVLLSRRFSMVGVTLATRRSVEQSAEMIDYIRDRVEHLPPIVVGGRSVEILSDVATRTGADYAVATAREAVQKCGLGTVAASLVAGEVC